MAGRAAQARIVCAWCQALLVDGDPNIPISHGICQSCADHMLSASVECEITGCGREALYDGLCPDHWRLVVEARRRMREHDQLVQVHPAIVTFHHLPIHAHIRWGAILAYVLALVGLAVALAMGVRG